MINAFAILVFAPENIVQLPQQRDAIRTFARAHGLVIEGEVLCEMDDQFNAHEEATHIFEKTLMSSASKLLVAEINDFNDSGIAAHLIPMLRDSGHQLIGVA